MYQVTVTDENGCTATDAITVEPCCELDVTCPDPDGGVFSCIADVPAPVTTLITINDYCISVSISSPDSNNEATGCGLDTLFVTRVYTVTDGLDNQTTCVQVFAVIDNTPPSITCPPNITVECTESTLPANTGTATGSDNCSGMVTIEYTDSVTPGPCSQETAIVRTWVATDLCGNSSTCQQMIFQEDSTPPMITCPPNVTISCNDSTQPIETGFASATDNCSTGPIVTFT